MAGCPICNGRGSVYNALGNFYEDCGRCQGTGKVRVEGEPLTNEEWFCQLPTEEKAVIFSLLSYRCNICDGTPTNQCPFDRCVRGLKDFIKWLKQQHREEKTNESV